VEASVNDQERYLFDLQGFLKVENALSDDQVVALNTLMDEQITQHRAGDEATKRFGRILSWGAATKELIDNPRISPYLRELLGDRFRLDHDYADVIWGEVGPIGTSLHGGGSPFDPSQYYHYANGRMYNGLTVVAYNLRDVNPGDGGFGCVPGSHKSNLAFPNEWRDLSVSRDIARAVPGKAGSAIIFTEALTHGTMPWKGPGERRTLFLKYCPHPLAWSRRYYDAAAYDDLTDEQRRILGVPGVFPPG